MDRDGRCLRVPRFQGLSLLCANQALKRSDVLKLPWPSLRKPPKPMTEQHLIEQVPSYCWPGQFSDSDLKLFF